MALRQVVGSCSALRHVVAPILILVVPMEGIFFMALSAWFSAGHAGHKDSGHPNATCEV